MLCYPFEVYQGNSIPIKLLTKVIGKIRILLDQIQLASWNSHTKKSPSEHIMGDHQAQPAMIKRDLIVA